MFNRSTIIQFICSPGSGKGEISFMEETNNCTYYFIWHTELACENRVHCMADSGSHVIDLSPLMRTDNYLAQQSDINNGDVYLISVCRPLNPVPAFPCPPESAACQTAIGHSKPTSLGQVMQSPEDEQGRVYLMYTHGSECPSKPHTRISSKIIFICRENAGTGTPKLMDKSEDCVYTFEWQTDIMKDDDISINVCGAISDSGPCAGSSICQGDKTSYGSASSVTSFITQENTLRIHFSNGSDCKDKKNLNSEMKKWASEIWFTCDPSTVVGSPVKINELPCYVYFHWKTSAVWSHSCVVFGNDGKVVDLGPLGSISHVWNVTDTSGNTYWINICHGLQRKSLMNSDCPPDATICMKSKSGVKMLGVLDTQKLAFNDKQNNSW
uniref:MRH domain-containing protein n=1 Tax=Strigamia maritima TaxID=126957 RepID=T1JC95_STRMM